MYICMYIQVFVTANICDASGVKSAKKTLCD